MSIITEFYSKIKQFLGVNLIELGVSLIIILVGICGFLLGQNYQYETDVYKEGVKIVQEKVNSNDPVDFVKTQHISTSSDQVVASKNGKRYYFTWCAAADRISVKNKIYFANAAEAMKAGFTKAANCKGM